MLRTIKSAVLLRLFPAVHTHRRLSRYFIRQISQAEGGDFYSQSARKLMLCYYNTFVGEYSYGPFLRPWRLPKGLRVGRYVSMADTAQITLGSKPMDRIAMHPFFYLHGHSSDDEKLLEESQLEICHDAWIGHSALILPKCSRIGIGAVIGAGAVVTRNVEDFEVVAGNPARTLRFRFAKDVCEQILESRWWEYSHEQLLSHPFMFRNISSSADLDGLHSLSRRDLNRND